MIETTGLRQMKEMKLILHTVVKVNLYGFTGTNLIVKQNFVSYAPNIFKVLEIPER